MLEHYRDDDEKRNAARFVIVNMVGATGSDKSVEDACDEFYEKYDSLMRIHGYDSLSAIFDYGKMSVWDKQVDSLWDEVKRFDNPHTYYVDLSKKLWDIKYNLLKENNAK